MLVLEFELEFEDETELETEFEARLRFNVIVGSLVIGNVTLGKLPCARIVFEEPPVANAVSLVSPPPLVTLPLVIQSDRELQLGWLLAMLARPRGTRERRSGTVKVLLALKSARPFAPLPEDTAQCALLQTPQR